MTKSEQQTSYKEKTQNVFTNSYFEVIEKFLGYRVADYACTRHSKRHYPIRGSSHKIKLTDCLKIRPVSFLIYAFDDQNFLVLLS